MSHAAEPSGFDESDLQASQTAGYKAPAQKSLQELAALDADDEAMQKYKAALLGSSAGTSAGAGGKPTVSERASGTQTTVADPESRCNCWPCACIALLSKRLSC